MAGTTLDSLPPEMLLAIASFLGSTGNISRLSRTSRRMREVLDGYLYRYDVTTSKSSPKALHRASCYPSTDREAMHSVIVKSLAAGADVNVALPIMPNRRINNYDDDSQTERSAETFHTTALAMAALGGKAALVQTLLDAGADVNATCWMGISVLGYAMMDGDLSVVRLLLAQPNIDIASWCQQQDAPLLTAVTRGALDLAAVLLSRADPNRPGREGISPLRLAVREQNYDMVALLLSDPRTDPNDVAAQEGATAMSIFALACSLKSTSIVKLLHDDGRTDVDLCLVERLSPATMAFYNQTPRNVDFLIRSTKCRTARNTIFCAACIKRDIELAYQVLSLSTEDDRIFSKNWVKEARAAGAKELAARVVAKWDHSTVICE